MYMRIRKAREDMGYTREKFAELLDVSVSYLAEVERGRTGISVKMLTKICRVLGLSADYVLFAQTAPRTPPCWKRSGGWIKNICRC